MTPPNKRLGIFRRNLLRTWHFWTMLLCAVALWNFRRWTEAAYPGDGTDFYGDGGTHTTHMKPYIQFPRYLQ